MAKLGLVPVRRGYWGNKIGKVGCGFVFVGRVGCALVLLAATLAQ